MAADFLIALLASNLAAGAAVGLVLLARGAVRRIAGARLAYWLWLTPFAAGIAAFLPALPAGVAPVATPIRPMVESTFDAAAEWVMPEFANATAPASAIDLSLVLILLWALGVLACLALTLWRQQRGMAEFGSLSPGPGSLWVASGQSGPAVVGLFRPRLVVPFDFESRFSERERHLVLAHERGHLEGGHTRINAGLALLSCINWFNPMVHLGVRCARTDQELSCDATVVERFPDERRSYAEALLKTQIAPTSLPLGCTWPARSSNVLKERVLMLARRSPNRLPRIVGVGLICAMVLGAGVAAWAVQPAELPVQPSAVAPDALPAGLAPGLFDPEQAQDTPAPSPQKAEAMAKQNAKAADLEQALKKFGLFGRLAPDCSIPLAEELPPFLERTNGTEEQVRFRARDGRVEFVYFSQAYRNGEPAEWKSWRFVISSAEQISANELELLGAFSEFEDIYRLIVWEKKDGRFRLKSIRIENGVYGVKDHVSAKGREYQWLSACPTG